MVRKGKCGMLHLRQIKYFLETGTYMSSVRTTEQNGIRKAAKNFALDGEFYYIGPKGSEKRLVLLTEEEISNAFKESHLFHKSEEHYGRTKTLKRLKEKYYWTSMVEDTVSLIVKCKQCHLNKIHKFNRCIKVTEPWEVVSIDILGQFSVTNEGYVFVAVIIDMFTKYSLGIPLRDTTVSDIADAIEKSIYQQGTPRKFVSDQNEEFVKELNDVLEIDKGLSKNVMAITKSQMNRPDEAAIKSQILKHCLYSGSTWSDSLQQKMYGINTSFITSCGHVPFYLMFHRLPKPVEHEPSLESTNIKTTIVVKDLEQYMEERNKKAKAIFSDVLSQQSLQTEATEESRNKIRKDDIEYIADTELIQIKQEEDHEYEKVLHEVPSISAAEKVEENLRNVVHIKSEQIMHGCDSSVYEMGDGEGQVVVVADGISGAGDYAEMVIVQPGLGDQGLIMLSSQHFNNYDLET